MKEFVLDCSAALPWGFASEATKATHALHAVLVNGGKAWVPALWHLELGNVLLGAKRKGRIDQAGIEKFLSTLRLYDIEVDHETMTLAWSKTLGLAENSDLTVYDAAYLELALRRGLPLATLDGALSAAMKQAGGKLLL
ncbi:MAG: twitching motility protein PilT [Lacunisphaera sp.]|nr:twitching motility protein PilT [Lacunisphaera sp.]MDB6165242.1 twitching motility protein PilT [Lacunisphaera sp.]